MGVWVTNSFQNTHSYDEIKVFENVVWPVENALHQENVMQWRDWLWHIGTKDPTEPEQVQESKTLRARVDAVEYYMCPYDECQEPPKSSKGEYVTSGLYAEVMLAGMAITSINGAKTGTADTANVGVARYFDMEKGLAPLYPRDLHSTLLVTKTIKVGQFLCLSYDGGKPQTPDAGYFCETDPGILWHQARGHEQMRSVISATVAVCGHLMPAHIEEYLRKCVSDESLERAVA